MAESIRVHVTVDTDELRNWAGRHADAGHHGVAHVLYKAAQDCESITEQAIREAERRGAERALLDAADDSLDVAFSANEDVRDWLRDRADRIGEEQ